MEDLRIFGICLSFLLSHIISNNPLSRKPSHTSGKEKKYIFVFPLKDKLMDSLQVKDQSYSWADEYSWVDGRQP